MDELDDRTWPQLAAAVRVATRALSDMTGSSREACVALDTMARILSDDWDGREGVETAEAGQ